MKSRKQRRAAMIRDYRACMIFDSVTDALREGTMLAWSLQHAADGRDAIARAWAECNSPVVMEIAYRRIVRDLYKWIESEPHYSCCWLNRCDVCCGLLRAQHSLTMADVIARSRG